MRALLKQFELKLALKKECSTYRYLKNEVCNVGSFILISAANTAFDPFDPCILSHKHMYISLLFTAKTPLSTCMFSFSSQLDVWHLYIYECPLYIFKTTIYCIHYSALRKHVSHPLVNFVKTTKRVHWFVLPFKNDLFNCLSSVFVLKDNVYYMSLGMVEYVV